MFKSQWDSLLKKKLRDRMYKFLFNWKTDCCYGRQVPFEGRHYCEFCLRDITVELQFDAQNEVDSFTKRYKEIYGKVRIVKVYQEKSNKNKNAHTGGEGGSPPSAWVPKKVPS